MSTNDITGDLLISRTSTEAYRSGWDRIFKKADVTADKKLDEANPAEYNDTSSSAEGTQCPKTTVKASSQ